jgi:hypothetical protein
MDGERQGGRGIKSNNIKIKTERERKKDIYRVRNWFCNSNFGFSFSSWTRKMILTFQMKTLFTQIVEIFILLSNGEAIPFF